MSIFASYSTQRRDEQRVVLFKWLTRGAKTDCIYTCIFQYEELDSVLVHTLIIFIYSKAAIANPSTEAQNTGNVISVVVNVLVIQTLLKIVANKESTVIY